MATRPQTTSLDGVEERTWVRSVAPHALIVTVLLAFTVHAHFRTEYALLTLFWAVLTCAGPRARRFASIAVPVLVVGVLYDQVLPKLLHLRPEVHVADVYHLELSLFGVPADGGHILPSEWLSRHTSPVLDLACGFGYMTYMFETFLVIGLLYVLRDEERGMTMSWAFLLCNVIGMGIWLAVPASPPWYVAQYGLGRALDVAPSAAGAARFDALIGFPYFAGFYARSHNVHGAMPSLHAAYPTVVAFFCWTRAGAMRWLTVAFAALIAFAAVYLNHHYVVDVLAGWATAFTACVMVWYVRRGASVRPASRVRDLVG